MIDQIIRALWVAMFAIWFLTGFRLKRTAISRSESGSRVAVYIVWAGWWLLFSHGSAIPSLARKAYEASLTTAYIGLIVTLAGLIFAIVARLYIGTNWSPLIQVKDGHELIETGPYALVRHPIYSGLMLASLGTAIAYGELSGYIGFVMVVAAWSYKSRLEEVAMADQFGTRYEIYRTRTKILVPFLW